jgi:diamine N-acetyltransferase
MKQIEIRRVMETDLEQLQLIGRTTFYETFAARNTEENIRQYLNKSFSTGKLTAELTNPDSEFYFALSDDRVVGYLKINYGSAQTELKDVKAVEIERIYVLREFYGKAVGQALFEKTVLIARERNAEYLWLGVWGENHRAVGFYRKNGFVQFGTHIFMMGKSEQTDLMMRLDLGM